MKKLTLVLLLPLMAVWLMPANVLADGTFVAPKFVWDKHKDINEPTQKAIIVRDAGREDLILQVKYEGPMDQFGWLIPVPNLPVVKNGSMKCFYELSQYTQQHFGDGDSPGPSSINMGVGSSATLAPPPVKVIETETVGAYDIAILSARESGGLKTWLADNQFYIPPDKSGVLDSYIKAQWYFIAVKINLGGGASTQLSTAGKLATGELNPLQISFASDKCVFPLKISSINGEPSEVQCYVLSPQPLLEKGMLEAKLPLIYSNDLVRAINMVGWFKTYRDRGRARAVARFGGVPPDMEGEEALQKWNGRLCPSQEELLRYTKISSKDLPECTECMPALASKSWWLTKETWTFQPEEMHDLTFEPAWPVFMEMLGSPYGYFTGPSLAAFGEDGIPLLLEAMQSTNVTMRTNAAATFNIAGNWPNIYTIAGDPRLTHAALTWIKDPEPSVRLAGIYTLAGPAQPNAKFTGPMTALLQDPDRGIRYAAVCDAGMEQNEPVSDEVLMALLQNSEPFARQSGLTILLRNADRESVELALPLLNDPDRFVSDLAGSTLRALTGQDFTDDQINEWNAWWGKNKMGFVVRLRPEKFGIQPINGR